METQGFQTRATSRRATMTAGLTAVAALFTASVLQAAAPIGQTVWIRATANGQLVSVNAGAEGPLFANRTAVTASEQFQVVDAGSGFIALRSVANGRYVSADQGRGANAPLVADRTAVADWERFTWSDVAGGFTLRGRITTRFVAADLNLTGRLVSDRTAAAGWETFTFGTSGTVPTPGTPTPTPVTPTPVPGWRLVWADEFNAAANTSVNTSRWNIATGDNINNHERQMYTTRIQDLYHDGQGNLVLQANRGGQGFNCWYGPCEYTSARINTSGKFSPTYGRFEARLRLPVANGAQGQGVWPAFWLLGANDNGCGGWPTCGEIDIMENLGQTPNRLIGTVHGPGYSGGSGIGASTTISGSARDFHVYAVEWEPNAIRWYIDGQQYFSLNPTQVRGNRWVFNHGFFIILNVAIGGDWPGMPNGSTVFPANMVVDYVRVYQR